MSAVELVVLNVSHWAVSKDAWKAVVLWEHRCSVVRWASTMVLHSSVGNTDATKVVSLDAKEKENLVVLKGLMTDGKEIVGPSALELAGVWTNLKAE